jgi:putative SOS response-associated peptidase YedK
MCSRYTLTSPPEAVRSYFSTTNGLTFPPRADIRPTEPVLIVRTDLKGAREQALVRWGMIPAWVKNPGEFATLINARSETADEKPSFRGPLRHRRCLVPADGFYEWTGPTRGKTKHLIRPKTAGGHLMALAGLWENWLGADGSEIETMAILTVAANTTVATIHDRMPVILAPAAFDCWLDCTPGSAAGVIDLMQPAPEALLEIITDSPRLLL